MVDELRDAARSMALTAQGIQTRLTMTEGLADSTRRNLKAAQEQARQASERLEGVDDPVKREAMIWARDLAQLRERVESARTGMLNADKTQIQEELTEAQQRIALLTRQRTVAAQQAGFHQAGLRQNQKTIRRGSSGADVGAGSSRAGASRAAADGGGQ